MALEIERKFLLSESLEAIRATGKLQVKSEQRIEQTYLAMDKKQELRIRRITDLNTGRTIYTHTFKRGEGMVREEVEYEISESLYEQVFNAFGAVPLTKNRVTADWEGVGVEIDVYDQLDLTVVEVEFGSEEEANAFVPPYWFGRDIGSEKQYGNKAVWRSLQKKKAGGE